MAIRLHRLRFGVLLLPYMLWIALMPITGQYDLSLNAWQAHHINRGRWNLYAYLSQVDNFASPGHPPAPYPFGFYLLNAGWIEALHRLGLIDYTTWQTPLVILESPVAILALKLPYVAAHLAIGLLLFNVAPAGWRWPAWAIWAWSLSPAYLLFMGQNDLPLALSLVAATALGACAVQQQQGGDPRWRLTAFASMALLGVGATYKAAPLMLVPPFALLLATRWRERAMLVALPVAIFALSALPFLGTSAFVNGALFNPEGTRLFAGVQVFAQPVSLFLVTYGILLLLLAVRPSEARQPLDVWWAGAAVFGALFLFAWTQFYWLVWLTPLLVGLIAQDAPRRAIWLGVWLVGEVAFGVLLFGLHRDLGWGLLGVASSQFRLAQFDVVLELSPFGLKQPFEAGWALLRSGQIAGWLVLLVTSGIALVRADRAPVFGRIGRRAMLAILGVPALACVATAGTTLFLSRNAVAQEFDRRLVGEVRLSAEQPGFTQIFSPSLPVSHGLLLWGAGSPVALPVEACAHTGAGAFCAPGRPVKQAYFDGYAFWFGALSGGAMRALAFRLVEPADASSLVVPVGRHRPRFGEGHYVDQKGVPMAGIARMTLLRPFDPAQAGGDILAWMARDWRAGALAFAVVVSVVGVAWGTVYRSRHAVRHRRHARAD